MFSSYLAGIGIAAVFITFLVYDPYTGFRYVNWRTVGLIALCWPVILLNFAAGIVEWATDRVLLWLADQAD